MVARGGFGGTVETHDRPRMHGRTAAGHGRDPRGRIAGWGGGKRWIGTSMPAQHTGYPAAFASGCMPGCRLRRMSRQAGDSRFGVAGHQLRSCCTPEITMAASLDRHGDIDIRIGNTNVAGRDFPEQVLSNPKLRLARRSA